MHDLDFSIDTPEEGLAVVWIKGTADMESHDVLVKHMTTARNHPAKNVVVDLRHLSFLTSLAIGELVRLWKDKKAAGGKVVLVGPNQYVAGVLSKARLDRTIRVCATLDEGLAACRVEVAAPAQKVTK